MSKWAAEIHYPFSPVKAGKERLPVRTTSLRVINL